MEGLLRFFPIVGIAVTALIFIVLRLKSLILKDGQKLKITILTSMRLTLGLILMLAGNEKLTGIPDIIGPNYLVSELEQYGLGLYGNFIAFSQFVIGFILLTNRLGVLGEIMALPMFANIFIITISLNWRGTPLEVGYLLTLNVFLILSNWHKVKFIIAEEDAGLKKILVSRSNIKLDMVYLLLFLVMISGLFLSYFNINLSKTIIKIGLVVMFFAFIFGNKLKRLGTLK